MAVETVAVEFTDSVSPAISAKIKAIAVDARSANDALGKLKSALAGISSSPVLKLQVETNKLNVAMTASAVAANKLVVSNNAAATSQQKLAASIQQTQAATANVEAALSRAIAAEAKANAALSQLAAAQAKAATEAQKLANSQAAASIATQNAAAASSNAATAQTNAATAAQRLATEQQRTAGSAANAAAAQTRAATATTQGSTAAANLGAATTRASTAQTQGATAAQRLATEQQRTATQTANAAAAADRAALASQRLAAAQRQNASASVSAANGALSFVKSAVLLAGIGLTAEGIVHAADAYTLLQNKLQNLTTSAPQAAALLQKLVDTANETRAPIDETVSAFQRMDNALKRTGVSQEESIRLVKSLNEIIAVSGATSTEASNGMIQFAQALGAGKLQGQDLRAIMEDIPGIAQEISAHLTVTNGVIKVTNDGIGISTGKFRELAHEGKLTATLLQTALAAAASDIDKKFSKTVPTISQSLTVLKNNAMQAFGQFNAATGFSRALSTIVITLANNLKTLGVILAVVGAALLVTFGPTILAAIWACTAATWAFTAALLANPIGLIAVAIIGAVAALALFGDEVTLGIDKTTTLGDVSRALWADIKAGASSAGSALSDVWRDSLSAAEVALSSTSTGVAVASNEWKSNYADFFTTTNSGWAGALEVVAKTVDAILGLLRGVGIFIVSLMSGIPDIFNAAFGSAYNAVAGWVEKMVNVQISAANVMRDAVGASLISAFSIDKIKVDTDAGKKYGAALAGSVDAGFKSQGSAAQDLVKTLFGQAQAGGAARLKNAGAVTGLRPHTAGIPEDEKADKGALKRVQNLASVNLKLDDEINRLGMLAPARELQAKYDAIEQELQKKHITLTASESSALKEKIALIQAGTIVQAKMDAIYEAAIGPQRDYNATLTAAKGLLDRGAISQAQYAGSVAQAADVFGKAHTPLFQLNKDLQQQMALLQQLPRDQQILQQIQQAQNDELSRGHILNVQELADLTAKLKAVQQLNDVSAQQNALLAGSVDKRKQDTDKSTAIAQLKANPKSGFTNGDAAESATTDLKGMGLDTTYLQSQTEAYENQYRNMLSHIKEMRDANVISERDAANATAQAWAMNQKNQLSGTQNFLGGLTSLMQSHSKTAFKVGKAAAIAQAGISTYLGAIQAFTSLSVIPIVGPILGGIAAAAAVASGLAQIQTIRSQQMQGYESGGYTGNGATNAVAGVVHGKEFVSDATTTARYRPQLEAMAAGTYSAGSASRGGSASGPVVVPPAMVRVVNVKSMDEARDFASSSENEQVVLNIMARNGLIK